MHCHRNPNVAFVGALMPISALVNGVSIARERRDRIEYWHVELDVHDVILAEGLPAESYLDCGNRAAFENGGAVIEAFPDFAPRHWSQTCLPLVERGPEVAATRSWLASRLRARGYALTGEDDGHVVADGRRIEPIRLAPTRLTFLVPEGARRVALRSRVFSPAGTTPDSADTRELGLGLSRLRIDGADVDLANDAALGAGWHAAEIENGAFARRWTRGEVDLPAGTRRVAVDLAERGLYWRAPGDDIAARSA